MRKPCVFFAFSVIFLEACSSPDAPKQEPPASGLATPEATRGLQVGMKVDVEAGKEVVVCRELVLKTATPIEIGQLEHASSPGTHHLHVYRTSTPADKVSPDVFPCGDLAGPLVYTTQTERDSTHFPPGVGVKFAEGEVIRLELHQLNTTGATITAEVKLDLWFATAPLTAEAGSFLLFDHDIAVPAHGARTSRMHCEIPADIAITSLLPHVHTHGTGERIYLSGKGLSTPKLLLDSKGYGDLETRTFDGAPILVKAGQALDFECDFKNDTDQGIGTGAAATTDEMCVVLGSYSPRLPAAAEWCTLPGSGALHVGTQSCKDAMSCLASKKDDGTFEQCACQVDVCQASSGAFDDVSGCGVNRCPAECPGEHCDKCLEARCPAEIKACDAAKCGN